MISYDPGSEPCARNRAIAIEISVHGWDLVKLLAEILGVEDVCDVGEDVLKEVG